MLPRKQYVNELMRLKENGRVKIITGLRRSGKSVLLFDLFRRQLLDEGVVQEQIIGIQLDDLRNMKYRDPFHLDEYIRSQITDAKKVFYVFIDEIQLVSEVKNPYVDNQEAKISFVDVVLGLLKIKNADVYVTGSNSKMLSSDVLTQFRDRGDEIRVFPLHIITLCLLKQIGILKVMQISVNGIRCKGYISFTLKGIGQFTGICQ